jgi:hypothetical protein
VAIRFTVYQSAHRFIRNIMHLSEGQNADIEFGELKPQSPRLFVGESCEAMPFAFRSFLAILGKHISNVFLLTASEKMRGIATSPHIAGVADEHTIRDRALRKGIGDSMRSERLCVDKELTVAVRETRALPQPAIIRASNNYFRPKSRFNGLELSNSIVMIMEESVSRFCDRLATAANAELDRLVGRGMLSHVVSSLLAIGQARDAANVAWRFYWGGTQISIAQMVEFA